METHILDIETGVMLNGTVLTELCHQADALDPAVEVQALVDRIDTANGHQARETARLTEIPTRTSCMRYREAKYLAASQRRAGTDAYAVYDVALGCWCVNAL